MWAAAAAPEPLNHDDWPWWRGPTRNGVARADQHPPTEWSETKNVLWKAPVPGRGHGSPTVVGEHVYLATAEEPEQLQSVLCFDRRSGKQLWKTIVHRGDRTKKGNAKASRASSTPACDGQRVYVNFLNNNAVYTTALSCEGKQLWQTKITDYTVHQGYGSSPAIYGSLVIVSADNKGGGAIAALDRETGDVVWKHERPKTPNYASPIILKVDGRDQLLFTGCNLVSSYNPADGKKLWEIAGATTECVTSIVTDGELVFTSGGYPKNHVSAVRGDGSGKIAWENKTRVYVPSMLVKDGHIYATLDAGIAACWEAGTGKQLWQHRLGGTFTSSPILVGENIYATNEDGTTFIFKADPEGFQSVGENHLGDEVFATPAICGGRIYIRAAVRKNGERREMLYCVGRTRE
jgi:outer membrane protein assembly factor BamB